MRPDEDDLKRIPDHVPPGLAAKRCMTKPASEEPDVLIRARPVLREPIETRTTPLPPLPACDADRFHLADGRGCPSVLR